ncbi:hypothetical protein FH5_00361 [Priestia endophytica]|nr:hypothetical protein FH5_00361 [Priestia endophytica]
MSGSKLPITIPPKQATEKGTFVTVVRYVPAASDVATCVE